MNVKNRTIFEGDNLPVLRGIDTESVDLIYLDPPFNSNRNYSAPIGSDAAGAAFKDTWTLSDVDNAWHGEIADREPALYQAIHTAELTHSKGMKSYLIMMAVRMLEMKRVLKETGSIYLHVDPTASHYLKLVMDSIFGKDMFRNEIVWHYNKWTNAASYFQRNHDVVLLYAKSGNNCFNKQYIETENSIRVHNRGWDSNKVNGKRQLLVYDTEKAKSEMRKDKYDVIVDRSDKPKGTAVPDVWSDLKYLSSASKERCGYPTQKPLTLLERIIKASSNEKDVVLDPFCGCATTCVAAERLGRQWIGVDLSVKAVELVKMRLETDLQLNEDGNLFNEKIIHRTDIPQRSEQLPDYRTHKHTLYGKQEGLCNGCKTQFPFRNMTIDHIVPQSQGGTDHIENLQILCGACNSAKGQGTQAELVAKLTEQGII